MKYSEFYRLIESYGWEKKTGKNKGTNHAKYVHPDFPYYIPVGRHTSQEVKPGTLNKMLKMARKLPTPPGVGLNGHLKYRRRET